MGRAGTSENTPSEQLGALKSARGRQCPACGCPKILPCEQPLQAQLSSAIAQNGVET
jgi:hypothetical protein